MEISIPFLFTMIIFLSAQAFGFSLASCGIKPPAPVKQIHGQAVCGCDATGNCRWLWVKK
jgi:hypothetical protein